MQLNASVGHYESSSHSISLYRNAPDSAINHFIPHKSADYCWPGVFVQQCLCIVCCTNTPKPSNTKHVSGHSYVTGCAPGCVPQSFSACFV